LSTEDTEHTEKPEDMEKPEHTEKPEDMANPKQTAIAVLAAGSGHLRPLAGFRRKRRAATPGIARTLAIWCSSMDAAEIHILHRPAVQRPALCQRCQRPGGEPRLYVQPLAVPMQTRGFDGGRWIHPEINGIADHLQQGSANPFAAAAAQRQPHPVAIEQQGRGHHRRHP